MGLFLQFSIIIIIVVVVVVVVVGFFAPPHSIDFNQFRDVDEVVQFAESKVTKRKNETSINDISTLMV
jgi:hypothetical protein